PGPETPRLAASMELLHTATLIHDDVIDQSEWRRGRRTVHTLWGENASVLSGDVLFAKAMRLLVDYGGTAMLQTITEAIIQVCEGEVDEIAINGELDVAVTAYLRVIEAKTASLLAACCRIGALAVDASVDQVDALGNYGRHLGLAFQIMDDLLDLAADPGLWGKPIGKDLQEGRMTLPLIYALRQTEGADHTRLLAILNNPEKTDALVSEVLEIARRYGCLDAVREDAMRHVRLARSFLTQLPPTEARETLDVLADYVLCRDR
ncbi:MAG TPA: polyprenyl synthetase family protein, partial [Armatimonadota bacterium]|nr:polyprenyl synthetase family protein [Armatimonadota bacterium]